ncbi:MerR family transcriptional regulator [Stakelama sp. CBK3Z-3]|uniref:MerR family transcriptional regulator n=1 Tax=Stakelama flava TaxID=2860338 RepID=A0ABS6XP04_9SPHN|nr:MerR family transcriptional regulator [Stakelama flava]
MVAQPPGEKASGAFRTIGEVSRELDLPQHRLRYWESRFPQLRPVKRAGQRRYYRAEDVALVRRIDSLLNREGYTIAGVQRLFAQEGKAKASARRETPADQDMPGQSLRAIRDALADALAADSR